MATCKDCLHNEICDILINTNRTINANNCANFKNKADYVEVVRCKDCTEWIEHDQECFHWYGFKENDFCSHGIRKQNKTCDTCRCNKVCDHNNFGFEDCGNYIPEEE